ncbi:MAG: hypothetical protein ACPGXL_03385 [Chitinophagales bacterium]
MKNVASTFMVFLLLTFMSVNAKNNNSSFVFKFSQDSGEVEFTETDALNLQNFLYTESTLLECDEKEVEVIVDSETHGKQNIVDELYRKGYVVLRLDCNSKEIVFTLSKTEPVTVNQNEVMSYEVVGSDDDYMVFKSPTYGKASPEKVVEQKEADAGGEQTLTYKSIEGLEYDQGRLISTVLEGGKNNDKEDKKKKITEEKEEDGLLTASQDLKYRTDIVNEFMTHFQNEVLNMEIDLDSSIILDADKIESRGELVTGEEQSEKNAHSPH